jgi:hypothetical protein
MSCTVRIVTLTTPQPLGLQACLVLDPARGDDPIDDEGCNHHDGSCDDVVDFILLDVCEEAKR